MKLLRIKKETTGQRRSKMRNRLIGALTASVVFATTFALALPAAAMGAETAAEADVAVGEKCLTTQYFAADGAAYNITLTYGPEAGIPDGAELAVSEIPEETETFGEYVSRTEDALGDEEKVTFARVFDIAIMYEGAEIQPNGPVNVKIELADVPADEIKVVHFEHSDAAADDGAETPVILDSAHVDTAVPENTVCFEADSFSTYVLVATEVITTEFLSSNGRKYEVTVTYGPDANIPEGSMLSVTDIPEGTADYDYARNAVLADKIEKGETVDIETFHLAALDISILDPDGQKIEPEAAVQVDIRIKELPDVEDLSEIQDTLEIQHHVEAEDGVVVETVFDGSVEGSYQMETNEKIVEEGTVVDPYSVNEEDLITDEPESEEAIVTSFETEVFSTFTISWGSGSGKRTSTIHYGYMQNGSFVEFAADPAYTTTNTKHREYLIRDFDGYHYSGNTYYRTSTSGTPANNGTRIQALLRYDSNQWKYHKYQEGYSSSSWNDMANNSHVYVTYEADTAITEGGTPKTKPVNPEEEPDDPSILKESVPNGDGTTNLSLSIRASTVDMEVEKLADVIVVFDVSGSMAYNMDGKSTTDNSKKRITIAQKAVNNLVDTLAKKKDSAGNPLVRMSLISFSTTAQNVIGLTDLSTQGVADYKAAVNRLSTGGGTNWEQSLQLANQTAVDPERATFVIFVSDGDPTFRVSRMNANDQDLDMFGKGGNEDYYLSDNVFGEGNADSYSRNYNAALNVAKSIVQHKKNFYNIGISNDVTNMERLNTAAGGQGSYTATSSAELEQAFDDIAAAIQAMMGFSDIDMTDGITDLSNTVMEKASLFGVSDDFTYWKAPAPAGWKTMTAEEKENYKPADNAFVTWDPASERCAPASYNTETGAVEWHMGSNFVPQDGCTYKVTFSVWPSQEAYDWIADLNNGTRTWADVKAAGLDYPDGANPQIVDNGNGTYSLATNKPGANTFYKSATKSGDTVTTSGEAEELHFNEVGPMALAEHQIVVRKRFAHMINAVSPLSQIEFTLLEDTVPYKNADGTDYTIVLPTTEGAQPDDLDKWQDDVFIAPGLIKTLTGDPDYLVLEEGHDYTLTERVLAGESYEYQFTPQIVRPMVVGTELKYFVKKDSEYNTNPDNKKEYTIDGGTYYELDADAQALTGTNRKTAELDITKKVVDAAGKMTEAQLAAETFTYKITLTVPDGADKSGIMGYEYVPRPNDTVPGTPERPRFYIFGYQAGDEGASPFADDIATFRGKVYGGWNAQIYSLFGDSNTVTFYMTLDNDEIIRLTNLPQGTTYTITEYYANVNASDVGAPTPAKDLASNVAAQGYTVSVKQDGSAAVVQSDTITGTITELDKRYYNQFTNTLGRHADVELKARKHLDGYTWSNEQYFINLSADDGNPMPGAGGRTRFYRQFAAGSAGDADQNGYTFGKIRFTEPGTYQYYIAEDDAGEMIDGIIRDESKTVTITIGENADGLYVEDVTGADTTWDAEAMTSMTTIINRKVTARVKVLKIGDEKTDNPLSDVSFELYSKYVDAESDQNVKAKKADGTEYGTLTTDEDGIIEIDGLIPGDAETGTTYYLVETEAKSGYNLLSSPVEVTVYLTDEKPYYEVSYVQSDYSASADAGRIRPGEDGSCLIVVDNKSGSELPLTGGSGTLPYTLGGIALVMVSALIFWFRKRQDQA